MGPMRSFWLLAAVLLAVALAGCTQAPRESPARSPSAAGPVQGLPAARAPEEVRLANGSAYSLAAGPVAKDPGAGKPVRMLAYNGQIPGPTLRIPQGGRVAVDFTNNLPFNTTVHWHGLRLQQKDDGVPGLSQAPVKPGETYRYMLDAPDEGVFWYHPHVREDMQQDLGLSGVLIVEGPRGGEPWPREVPVVLDDILVQDGDLAPFGEEAADRALMGRYGNRYLTNGEPLWRSAAAPGERVRLYLLDAANARPFQIAFQGAASVEWIGSDGGFLRSPRPVASLALSPGERAAVDIVMPTRGNVTLLQSTPNTTRELGRLEVAGAPGAAPEAPRGPHGRAKADLAPALARAAAPPAITWELDLRMAGAPGSGMAGPGATMGQGSGGMTGMMGSMEMGAGSPAAGPMARSAPEPVEWEEPPGAMNAAMTSRNVEWVIRDPGTGKENMALNYSFKTGDYVSIRIKNLATSMHPMQHPIHLHGQRFVVASVDGVPNPDPAWKDTVLVPAGGEVVITAEMSNPGTWLFHCHISEHLKAGMTGAFTVA